MSLSFVSSAVLSSSDGVSHNEEKPIDNQEASKLRTQQAAGSHKSLHEQLQYNRDQEKDKYDEMTKAMRGSRTLDEEDCAHLDSVEAMRAAKDSRLRRSVEEEVAEFRAARADRNLARSSLYDEEGGEEEDGMGPEGDVPAAVAPSEDRPKNVVAAPVVPIIVRRKRRRTAASAAQQTAAGSKSSPDAAAGTKDGVDGASSEKKIKAAGRGKDADKKEISADVLNDKVDEAEENAKEKESGLGGLLGGYGSESDSD